MIKAAANCELHAIKKLKGKIPNKYVYVIILMSDGCVLNWPSKFKKKDALTSFIRIDKGGNQ